MHHASIYPNRGFLRRSGRILLTNVVFVALAITGHVSQFAIDCLFKAGILGVSSSDGSMHYMRGPIGTKAEFPRARDGGVSALLLIPGQALGVCSGAYFYRKHLTLRGFLFPYVWDRALCYGLTLLLAWTAGIIVGAVMGDVWVTFAPILSSFVFFFVLSLYFAKESARDLVITRFRKCPSCEYLIRGEMASACPECGERRELIESAWRSTPRMFELFFIKRPAIEFVLSLGLLLNLYWVCTLVDFSSNPQIIVRCIYWPLLFAYFLMISMGVLASKSILRGEVGNKREEVIIRRCFRLCYVPLILGCVGALLPIISPDDRNNHLYTDLFQISFFWSGMPIQLALSSVKGARR